MEEGREATVITGEGIRVARLLSLRGGLKLEIKGMKHSRFNAHKILKEDYNLKGNRQQVLEQVNELLKEYGL